MNCVMGYYIPVGYSRVTFSMSGPSTFGSLPSWGFGCSAPPTPELLEAMVDFADDTFQPTLHNSYRINRIEVRDNVVALDEPVALQGTVSGTVAPPQIAALVSMRSALIGKEHRGRMYWPGVLLDQHVQDDGSILPDRLDTLNLVLDILKASLEELFVPATLVVLHGTELVPTEVTTAVVQGQTATMRRRNRR